MSPSHGIHHITAVAGDPKPNHDFYTGILGLKLVKKTVNFDDPSAYHLYYGNTFGDPGSIITFFCWPRIQAGNPDRGQVISVGFAVPTESKEFWLNHLSEQGIDFEAPFERFGKEVIGLQDPDGLFLELVFDAGADIMKGWESEHVPPAYSIRDIHGASLAKKDYSGTAQLLKRYFDFKLTDQLDKDSYTNQMLI